MKRVIPLAMLIVACGRANEKTNESSNEKADVAADSTAVTSAVTSDPSSGSSSAVSSAPLVCPNTGAWMPCSVIYRLERSGLAPVRDSSAVTEPPLSFPGVLLHLGRGELELYIYGSASERERDQSRLDASKYVVYPAPMPMRPVPTLITSANLIAVLHSRNDHLRERVSDAITAGPPQPPSSRP